MPNFFKVHQKIYFQQPDYLTVKKVYRDKIRVKPYLVPLEAECNGEQSCKIPHSYLKGEKNDDKLKISAYYTNGQCHKQWKNVHKHHKMARICSKLTETENVCVQKI